MVSSGGRILCRPPYELVIGEERLDHPQHSISILNQDSILCRVLFGYEISRAPNEWDELRFLEETVECHFIVTRNHFSHACSLRVENGNFGPVRILMHVTTATLLMLLYFTQSFDFYSIVCKKSPL